jgi:hypothetical protein
MAARGDDISMAAVGDGARGAVCLSCRATCASDNERLRVGRLYAAAADEGRTLAAGVQPISIQEDEKTNSNLKMLAVNSLAAHAGEEKAGGGLPSRCRHEASQAWSGWIVNAGRASPCRYPRRTANVRILQPS